MVSSFFQFRNGLRLGRCEGIELLKKLFTLTLIYCVFFQSAAQAAFSAESFKSAVSDAVYSVCAANDNRCAATVTKISDYLKVSVTTIALKIGPKSWISLILATLLAVWPLNKNMSVKLTDENETVNFKRSEDGTFSIYQIFNPFDKSFPTIYSNTSQSVGNCVGPYCYSDLPIMGGDVQQPLDLRGQTNSSGHLWGTYNLYRTSSADWDRDTSSQHIQTTMKWLTTHPSMIYDYLENPGYTKDKIKSFWYNSSLFSPYYELNDMGDRRKFAGYSIPVMILLDDGRTKENRLYFFYEGIVSCPEGTFGRVGSSTGCQPLPGFMADVDDINLFPRFKAGQTGIMPSGTYKIEDYVEDFGIDENKPLNQNLLEKFINEAWRQVAQEEGYDGEPYVSGSVNLDSVTMPELGHGMVEIPDINSVPDVDLSIGSTPDPGTDPNPGTDPDPGTDPGGQGSNPGGTPSADINVDVSVDFGPDPGVPAPALSDIPTAEHILSPVFRLFPSLQSFEMPAHSGECPTATFELWGDTYVIDAHCSVFEEHRALIQSVMGAVWLLFALFIVLEA